MSGEPSSGCAPLTPPIAALQPSHRASWCVQRIGETCSWCAAPWAVLLADCRLRAGTSTACLVGKVRGQQELCVRNESLVGQFLPLAQSGRRCLMSDVSNVDGTLTCWDSNLLPPFRPRRPRVGAGCSATILHAFQNLPTSDDIDIIESCSAVC